MKLNRPQQMESHNGSTGKETPALTESVQETEAVNVCILFLFPYRKLTVEELLLTNAIMWIL